MAKYCPNCGEDIIKDMKFCAECGIDLSKLFQKEKLQPSESIVTEEKEDIPTTETPSEESSIGDIEEIPTTEIPSEDSSIKEKEERLKEDKYDEYKPFRNVKRKRKGFFVLIIIFIGILIFAIIYMGFRGREDNPFASITDSDGDGHYDNEDAFINDKNEWKDSDKDGVGDNRDAFPNDPKETKDTDGDGVGDNGDAFPNDPKETKDTDGDGVGDNGDAFPNDPKETKDTDGDGVGDNGDVYDNGNGGLFFTLWTFECEKADFWSDSDPYIIIWVDLNENFYMDSGEYKKSLTYQDTNIVYWTLNFSLDIPEETEYLCIYIYAYDEDGSDDDLFDINPNYELQIFLELYYPSIDGDYVEFMTDGSVDGEDGYYDGSLNGRYCIQEI